MTKQVKSQYLSLRVHDDLHKMIEDALEIGPYRITKTALIERGIVLACEELYKMAGELAQ